MTASLLTDRFMQSLEQSAAPLSEAVSLPPACYTDPEFYAFEKSAVFDREWLCVGRESWAAEPGDFFTSAIVEEPIVVARDRTGTLNAMSSVCRHRAMLVAEGRGNARGFVCPYHHWTYGLDGRLVSAPQMQDACGFDKADHGLPRLGLEVWEGFVFVNFDADAAPLAPRLAAVADAVAPYRLAEASDTGIQTQRFGWNWKVMFENNNDGYHADRLHAGPLHDFVPSALASFPEADPASSSYLRLNGTLHPDASFNATQRALLPVFPGLGEAERARMTFANLPPTLSLVMTSDMVIYLILRADGAETHEMDTGVLVAPGAEADPSFGHRMAMNMAAAGEIIAQDLHVDELVQKGLRSRFAPRGRYSWQEGAQGQLNRWLVHRYRRAWAERRAAAPPSLHEIAA